MRVGNRNELSPDPGSEFNTTPLMRACQVSKVAEVGMTASHCQLANRTLLRSVTLDGQLPFCVILPGAAVPICLARSI